MVYTPLSFDPITHQASAYANTSISYRQLKSQQNQPHTENDQSAKMYGNQSVKVSISDEAMQRLGMAQNNELSSEEVKEVEKLAARDQEVRDHERAHMMAGGRLVRKGASFQYTTGPDGKRYAIGGEVSIDTSTVKDNPEATITKMQQVRRAALAPAEPSGQDRGVATEASQKETQARQELREQTMQQPLQQS